MTNVLLASSWTGCNQLLIFNVRQKTEARYSYRLDVRPSVTRWYCVKTAQTIVKLSLLGGSVAYW